MKRFFFLLLFPFVVHAESISIQLDEVPLADFVKLVFSEITPRPHILSNAVLSYRNPITVSLKEENPSGLLAHVDRVLSSHGFAVLHHGGVVWIDKAPPVGNEYVVYRPRHRPVSYLAEIIRPLLDHGRVDARPRLKPGELDAIEKRANDDSAIVTTEADQLAFSVKADKAAQLRRLLVELDQPTGEVLLKAAVYEVATSQQDGTAVRLALSLSGISAGIGGAGNGSFVSFAAGGLDVLLSALDSDSRFKSISRPQVRVKNGAEARFSVGQDVPVLGAQQLDRNGNPIQSVEYKQSGIILTARPEVRAEVIELVVGQELSSFTATNTGVNNSPTLIKRAVNTSLTLKPGEVVIIAGLQEDKSDQQQQRVPFLGWLIGDQQQQQQTEILVFIEAIKI